MTAGTDRAISTLNVNGLNAPIKRESGSFKNKTHTYIYCRQETPFRPKDTQPESKGNEKRYLMQTEIQRKSGSSTYARKIHFKIKSVARDKKGKDIMIKG